MTWGGGLALALCLVGAARTAVLTIRSVRGVARAIGRMVRFLVGKLKRSRSANQETPTLDYGKLADAIVNRMESRVRSRARGKNPIEVRS